jgi:hypothetical protein
MGIPRQLRAWAMRLWLSSAERRIGGQIPLVRYVICLHKQLIAHATLAGAARRKLVAFDNDHTMNGTMFIMNYAVHTGHERVPAGCLRG